MKLSLLSSLSVSLLGLPALAQSPSFTEDTGTVGLAGAVHMLGDTGSLTMEPFVLQTTLGAGGVGDFDNDGDQDFFFVGGGGGTDKVYWNDGAGTFTQATNWWVDSQGTPITPDSHVGGGPAIGDFDGNGYMDIFVPSLGLSDTPILGYHRLYANNGDGTFEEVAVQAGVNWSSPILPDGTTATWGDYDLDGDLDLFIGGWRVRPAIALGNRLYRNNGNGTFTDVTILAGVNVARLETFTPIFCDMNGDIYPELLLASDRCFTRYFINDGDGTFTHFTNPSGTNQGCSDMGATVGDFDRDGLQDWYITQINQPANPLWDGNHLYLNNGNHTYFDVGQSQPIYQGAWGWGTSAVDFNHDETLDLIEVNGMDQFSGLYENIPSFLWTQDQNGNWTEVSVAAGISHVSNGRGTIPFDCDNDVDMDVIITSHDEPTVFFRNDVSGPGTNAIRIFLDTSADPNLAPHGIGSLVTATTPTATQYFAVGARTTHQGQGEHSAHFGLGSNSTVDLTVRWNDGTTTTMLGVAANQTITIAAP